MKHCIHCLQESVQLLIVPFGGGGGGGEGRKYVYIIILL